MNRFLLIILFLCPLAPAWAQSNAGATPAASESTATPGPGPGRPLPEHSKEPSIPLYDIQTRALQFSGKFRDPATDLFSFLAVLALIWTGYHAQFRGLQEFVGTLLRIVVTSALILEYTNLIPTLFESRDILVQQVSPSELNMSQGFLAAFNTIGITALVMSVSGIAVALSALLVILGCIIVYVMQILFESVLLVLGPLAIATIAFRATSGIFTMWLKTLVAVLLIPVGWSVGASLLEMFIKAPNNSEGMLATFLFVAALAAIYIGMPFITLSIVNAAGGAVAAAMPSIMSAASSLMMRGGAGMMGARGGGGGASPSSSSQNLRMTTSQMVGGSPVQTTTSISVPAAASAAQMQGYEQRLAKVHAMNMDLTKQNQRT